MVYEKVSTNMNFVEREKNVEECSGIYILRWTADGQRKTAYWPCADPCYQRYDSTL